MSKKQKNTVINKNLKKLHSDIIHLYTIDDNIKILVEFITKATITARSPDVSKK